MPCQLREKKYSLPIFHWNLLPSFEITSTTTAKLPYGGVTIFVLQTNSRFYTTLVADWSQPMNRIAWSQAKWIWGIKWSHDQANKLQWMVKHLDAALMRMVKFTHRKDVAHKKKQWPEGWSAMIWVALSQQVITFAHTAIWSIGNIKMLYTVIIN